ncbi:MAG: Rsd/AlgQ family anti-sigma factor [Gammaproteobacteria bacterium]|nr:Rsd/AlgQ family anti-sigma factor [Gammaproteobacteria bacterium]
MPSDDNHAREERRSQTRLAIDRLLEERQKVLVQYERVTGVQPFDDQPPGPDSLEEFSQLLVDYVALGHFGLYQRITQGTERRKKVLNVAGELYPKIAATTEKALDFNDAYDQSDKSASIESLGDQLSRLGEVLAYRIELEDRLIAAMLSPRPED